MTGYGNSMNSSRNINALVSVHSFGSLGIVNWNMAFFWAKNLLRVPPSLPAGAINISNMFVGAEKFNSDISRWDVSSVTNM